MLESIEIKNFKRIGSDGLKLNNLAKVNYLVGKNGSGKSSVLECLYLFSCNRDDLGNYITLNNNKTYQPKFDFIEYFRMKNWQFGMGTRKEQRSPIEITINKSKLITEYSSEIEKQHNNFKPHVEILQKVAFIYNTLSSPIDNMQRSNHLKLSEGISKLKELSNKNKFKESNRVYNLNSLKWTPPAKFSIRHAGVDIFSFFPIDTLNRVRKEFGFFDDEVISSGVKSLMYFNLLRDNFFDESINLILIEEPEITMHPQWQKYLPIIYNKLVEETGCQVIISTHSPFIISATAELSEQEFNYRQDKSISYKHFQPTQKVYQIEDGQCQEPYGHWGNGCVQKSAEMLGAGLFDFHNISKTKIINDVYQIYCEGTNSEVNDAEFYNLVSKNWDKNVIFIGCNGCSEVNKQASIMNEFNKLQTGQTKVIAFFDSDKKDKYNGLEYAKFTNRYEFENYLYDPKIVCSCFEITQEEYIPIIGEDWKNKNLKKLHKDCRRSISKQTKDISRASFERKLFEHLKENTELLVEISKELGELFGFIN